MTSDVKWVKFKDREGPVVHGTMPYECPPMASEDDLILTAVCVCEGSRYDSVNMYDRAVVSLGLLQWGEHVGKASRFLGYAAEAGCEAMINRVLEPLYLKTAVRLERVGNGSRERWRFTYAGSPIETSESLQSALYFCDGASSSWNDERQSVAIEWARAFHEILSNIPAYVQRTYAHKDIYGYVVPNVKSILFNDTSSKIEINHLRAARALYVAMAVNSPAGARNLFEASLDGDNEIDDAWCERFVNLCRIPVGNVPKQFANRYVRAKPRLEAMYSIKLP